MTLYTKIQKFHYPSPISGKLLTVFMLFLAVFASISGHSCERHESKYQITYGESQDKLAVTQYFSLGSSEFVKFIKEEFPSLKEDFIDTELVSWAFCPHIADVTTIQLASCLETLSEEKKPCFFDKVLLELNPRSFRQLPQIFLRTLERISLPVQDIKQLQLLKIGKFFEREGEFLDREVFANSPLSMGIGEQIFDSLIHPAAIRYQIEKKF